MTDRATATSARHWSTDQVEQRCALAYWVDTVCDQFLEIDIDTPLRDRFRARLDQVEFGAATLSLIEADIQRVSRTPAKIARTRYPVCVLMQLRAGHMRLKQLGRETRVSPGECVFVLGTEPYELECPQATSAVTLRLPEGWLTRWLPHPERCASRLFSGSGWSAALCAAVSSLDVASCEPLALPNSAVAEHIAALLALAAGPGSQSDPRPDLFKALLYSLRDRLHEADLSPLALAAEHGISRRSLHYAFARAGTTFVEQLMSLRLERARELLSDPRLADVPISEVAARCGFMDPSHFARRFRQRFAQAPAQFRRPTRVEH